MAGHRIMGGFLRRDLHAQFLPSAEHDSVGVVPRKPESVTSSTVSPIDNTSVALTNDTIM